MLTQAIVILFGISAGGGGAWCAEAGFWASAILLVIQCSTLNNDV
ncbi:hypothetical protein [Chlorobium sp. N1]|nr:hypothetical protein [Chlorobium sp. N1]